MWELYSRTIFLGKVWCDSSLNPANRWETSGETKDRKRCNSRETTFPFLDEKLTYRSTNPKHARRFFFYVLIFYSAFDVCRLRSTQSLPKAFEHCFNFKVGFVDLINLHLELIFFLVNLSANRTNREDVSQEWRRFDVVWRRCFRRSTEALPNPLSTTLRRRQRTNGWKVLG